MLQLNVVGRHIESSAELNDCCKSADVGKLSFLLNTMVLIGKSVLLTLINLLPCFACCIIFGGKVFCFSASHSERCNRCRCLYMLAFEQNVMGQFGHVYNTSPVCTEVCSCKQKN